MSRAYGFNKRDAQRLDRTNRRVEQMADGTGQTQTRRHRQSPQNWGGYAISASISGGVLTVTSNPGTSWNNRPTFYNSFSQYAGGDTLSITVGTSTIFTIYRNIFPATGNDVAPLSWWVSSGTASGTRKGIGQLTVATITVSAGSITAMTRAPAMNGEVIGLPGEAWMFGYDAGTGKLTMQGTDADGSGLISEYQVTLPSDSNGPVYMAYDYDTTTEELSLTNVGYDMTLQIARYYTDTDGKLTGLFEKRGLLVFGIRPKGLTQELNVGHPTDPDNLYIKNYYIRGILVKSSVISK